MSWAAEYVGIPYLLGGRTWDGIDCWGLVEIVYRAMFDIELEPHNVSPGESWHDRATQRQGELAEEWREVEEPVTGDVYLFTALAVPCHVGIHVSPKYFLHTCYGQDSGLQRWNDHFKQRRIGCYRHRAR